MPEHHPTPAERVRVLIELAVDAELEHLDATWPAWIALDEIPPKAPAGDV